MSGKLKKLLSVGVSALLVFVVYRNLDSADLSELVANASPEYAGLYLLLFIPQLVIAAWRWAWLVRSSAGLKISLWTAFGQVLGSYSANLLIPGKLGEFFRSFWLDSDDRPLCIFLVILEKILDVTVILILMVAAMSLEHTISLEWLASPKGLVWVGGVAALLLLGGLLRHKRRLGQLADRVISKRFPSFQTQNYKHMLVGRTQLAGYLGCSLLLWIVQIYQFHIMLLIMDTSLPLPSVYAGAALALLAGAMPFTIGGIGARDAALLWYFGSLLQLEVVLGLGMLSLLRVIIPGVLGIPFFLQYNLQGKKDASGR